MPSTLSQHTDSYYAATANNLKDYPQLQGEHRADVCIIGAGYTGLSAALNLAEKGYSVCLLEAEKVGWGASGRNGGHVGTGQRKDQEELEAMVGLALAKTLWQYSLEAVDDVERLIKKHNIECDLKRGNIHLAAKPKHEEWLREEVDVLNNRYDYDKVRFLNQHQAQELVGSDRYFAGTMDEGALHLHPLNFALGLAAAAEKAGVKIFENSRVESYNSGEPVTVKTEQGQVVADYLVLACNGYLGKLEPRVAGKIMPINNFILATEPLPEELARELIANDASVADTLFVINYWKLSGDNRLLFGGGENYTSRFPADIPNFVRKYMLRVYPQLAGTKIDYGWGGTLAVTVNRMPHFGRLENNIFYAQGYSGHGVPTAVMGGKLLSEVISGTAERFDIMANVPTTSFPGGTMLRWPGLVAGMLFYSMMDKF
jgi:gamma-glutamylputrescine oxidase